MSWTESELRTPSLEQRLEEILEEEELSGITIQQEHRLLDMLDIHGGEHVRGVVREMKAGA